MRTNCYIIKTTVGYKTNDCTFRYTPDLVDASIKKFKTFNGTKESINGQDKFYNASVEKVSINDVSFNTRKQKRDFCSGK